MRSYLVLACLTLCLIGLLVENRSCTHTEAVHQLWQSSNKDGNDERCGLQANESAVRSDGGRRRRRSIWKDTLNFLNTVVDSFHPKPLLVDGIKDVQSKVYKNQLDMVAKKTQNVMLRNGEPDLGDAMAALTKDDVFNFDADPKIWGHPKNLNKNWGLKEKLKKLAESLDKISKKYEQGIEEDERLKKMLIKNSKADMDIKQILNIIYVYRVSETTIAHIREIYKGIPKKKIPEFVKLIEKLLKMRIDVERDEESLMKQAHGYIPEKHVRKLERAVANLRENNKGWLRPSIKQFYLEFLFNTGIPYYMKPQNNAVRGIKSIWKKIKNREVNWGLPGKMKKIMNYVGKISDMYDKANLMDNEIRKMIIADSPQKGESSVANDLVRIRTEPYSEETSKLIKQIYDNIPKEKSEKIVNEVEKALKLRTNIRRKEENLIKSIYGSIPNTLVKHVQKAVNKVRNKNKEWLNPSVNAFYVDFLHYTSIPFFQKQDNVATKNIENVWDNVKRSNVNYGIELKMTEIKKHLDKLSTLYENAKLKDDEIIKYMIKNCEKSKEAIQMLLRFVRLEPTPHISKKLIKCLYNRIPERFRLKVVDNVVKLFDAIKEIGYREDFLLNNFRDNIPKQEIKKIEKAVNELRVKNKQISKSSTLAFYDNFLDMTFEGYHQDILKVAKPVGKRQELFKDLPDVGEKTSKRHTIQIMGKVKKLREKYIEAQYLEKQFMQNLVYCSGNPKVNLYNFVSELRKLPEVGVTLSHVEYFLKNVADDKIEKIVDQIDKLFEMHTIIRERKRVLARIVEFEGYIPIEVITDLQRRTYRILQQHKWWYSPTLIAFFEKCHNFLYLV